MKIFCIVTLIFLPQILSQQYGNGGYSGTGDYDDDDGNIPDVKTENRPGFLKAALMCLSHFRTDENCVNDGVIWYRPEDRFIQIKFWIWN